MCDLILCAFSPVQSILSLSHYSYVPSRSHNHFQNLKCLFSLQRYHQSIYSISKILNNPSFDTYLIDFTPIHSAHCLLPLLAHFLTDISNKGESYTTCSSKPFRFQREVKEINLEFINKDEFA